MIAFKGFNKNLACTMGKGTFQYQIGETYEEENAKCANTGFHCVEEPIEVLSWYSAHGSRYCVVDAGGDVHEDGDNRISCTKMKVLKEITLQQLGIYECKWIMDHPERKCSRHIQRDTGSAESGRIVIVRGKNPKASGKLGSTIFLLKEGENTIEEIGVFEIDGTEYKEDVYYRVNGSKHRCGKKS